MTMQQFRENGEWYYRQVGVGSAGGTYSTFMENLVTNTNGLRIDPVANQGGTSVLWYGKGIKDGDEQAWYVTLAYAPRPYNQNADSAAVDVPVQLYTWEKDAEVERIRGGNNPLLYTKDPAEFNQDPGDARYDEFNAIPVKWRLQGSYGNDFLKDTGVKKPITLTKDMFYAGYYGASVYASNGNMSGWASLDLGSLSTVGTNTLVQLQLVGDFSAWNASYRFNEIGIGGNSVQPGQSLSDYPLPLYYRGVYFDGLDREADNVLIDLKGK